MGRASRKKEEWRALRRDRPDVEKKLRDHHGLLVVLGRQFDEGATTMALPLAVSVRVMVHDTKVSRSLLDQLEVKDTLEFVDTAFPIDPRNLLPTPGLVVLKSIGRGDGRMDCEWVPRLENVPPPLQGRVTPFSAWWNDPVLKDTRGKTWSRRRLILAVANEEGGAHVSLERDEDLRQFEEENGFG